MNKLLKYWKILLFVNALIIYFVALNLVSAIKNIPETQIFEKNAVTVSEFSVKSDQQLALVGNDKLEFKYGEGLKEFSAPVSLSEGVALHVQFNVSVPEESAGKTLHIDLFQDENYDNDESQINATLKVGTNQVRGTLSFGDTHPDACNLRIFTADDINACIRDIQIDRLEPFDGITSNVIISSMILLLFLLLMALFLVFVFKKEKAIKNGEKGSKIQKNPLANFFEFLQETTPLIRFLTIISALFVLMQISYIIWINLTQLQYHIGYDTSSTYLQAFEIWRQGTWNISNYVYTTSVTLDTTVPLAALLMNFFHNIFISYGVANIIFCVAIIVLLWEVFKQFNTSYLSRFLALNLVLCPYYGIEFNNANDIGYAGTLFFGGGAYSGKVILLLLFICCIHLFSTDIFQRTKIQKIIFFCSVLFVAFGYFLTGFSSGLYMAITVLIPYIIVGVIRMLVSNSLQELKTKAMLFTYSNIILVFMGQLFASKIFDFSNKGSEMAWINVGEIWRNIGSTLQGYFLLLNGLPRNKNIKILTNDGVTYIFGLAIVVITLIAFIIAIVELIKKTKAFEKCLFPVIFVVYNVVVFALCDTTYGDSIFEYRYLTLLFFMIIITFAVWITSLKDSTLLKQFGCSGLLICVAILSLFSYHKYLTTKIDISLMEQIRTKVSQINSPVVYCMGDAIFQRNMRVFDTNKIYKPLSLSDKGVPSIVHWGDYTYYDYDYEWNGSVVLCADETNYNTLPLYLYESFKLWESVGTLNIYVSQQNVVGLSVEDLPNASYNYLPYMSCSDETMRDIDQTIRIAAGQILYGPYIDLKKGIYTLTIDADFQVPVSVNITAESGKKTVQSFPLVSGKNTYTVELAENMVQVEFTVRSISDDIITVRSVHLKKGG